MSGFSAGPDPRLVPGVRVRLHSGEEGIVQPYEHGLADPQVPIRLGGGQVVVRSMAGIAAVGAELHAKRRPGTTVRGRAVTP